MHRERRTMLQAPTSNPCDTLELIGEQFCPVANSGHARYSARFCKLESFEVRTQIVFRQMAVVPRSAQLSSSNRDGSFCVFLEQVVDTSCKENYGTDQNNRYAGSRR